MKNDADLKDLDENDQNVVLSRFMAYFAQFERNEIRTDQSDQPNDLLRLNARPVTNQLQNPDDARRNPRFRSRFCFLMVVGAMKCFNKSMRTVMLTLKENGFVSQFNWEAFEKRAGEEDFWRRTGKLPKFCNILNKFNINLEQVQVNAHAQGEEMEAVLQQIKGVCSALSLREVFRHILFFSTYQCSDDDKCWKAYELYQDVFKKFDSDGNTVSYAINDITRFILENWVQWQDWILARLQQAAGIHEPEDVEPEFDFESKQTLQVNWCLDDRAVKHNLLFRSFCWFQDMLHTRTRLKVHIPEELSKLQTLGDFLAVRGKTHEKGKGQYGQKREWQDNHQQWHEYQWHENQWPAHQWHEHQWPGHQWYEHQWPGHERPEPGHQWHEHQWHPRPEPRWHGHQWHEHGWQKHRRSL